MTLALLFLFSEENLKDAQKRLTLEQSSLTFNTFSAGEKGNSANSHILVANKEALLVDAQLSKSEAKKLARMIKDFGKPLSTIVLTSSHPDRYSGLPVLKEAFPAAKVVSSAAVAKDIAEGGVTAVDKLELAGNVIQIIPTDGAETAHGIALYVPTLKVLITGNLVTGNAHAAVNNGAKWAALIDGLKKGREIDTVLTGRGDVGDASLLGAMKAYVQTPKDKLREKFPAYKSPQVLE